MCNKLSTAAGRGTTTREIAAFCHGRQPWRHAGQQQQLLLLQDAVTRVALGL